MSLDRLHNDWLSLVEISGPFLAVPVLKDAFPQGLEELDNLKRKRLRQAYEEWREALETNDPQFPELHTAWINEVLERALEFDEGDVLKKGDTVPASLHVVLPEHDVSLAPDYALIDAQDNAKPLLLFTSFPAEMDLESTLHEDGWASTPGERMVQLCRMTGCRLGLVTNGERWMLVDAPIGAVTTFASWYARLWGQEPVTLQAFLNLLGVRRFFVDASQQLPALLDRSLKYQDEVTVALGEQVRRAVEVLIQALDRADLDRSRELLKDISTTELYEAGLTVMMRLVFLLSAEERGLLLLGDERYETNYALSTLRTQLRAEAEEILERRWDAWSRLLALFRAVFGGIAHENLRMPALGGSLFDPDRFPFLEGRAKGKDWRADEAKPLPIDNRTVLLLLDSIQQFKGRSLSYRALDVEQLGYVYEGLLERTVKRTDEVTIELDATKNAKHPWAKLGELESAKLDGNEALVRLLQEVSGSSATRIENDLAKAVDDPLADRLLTACQGDLKLRDRIKPYAHLLRTDPWGYPLVYPKNAFIVTTGSDRRETGTHYTPKSLTEAIIEETLKPAVYVGPADGKPREKWVLKTPAELLDLKVCDPAMGSGAFLVQACRWMAERLVESWAHQEGLGQFVTVDGDVYAEQGTQELLPRDVEARTVIARRLIAERCLYGVDMNPLAVELAKLSIWLVTLAKGRPFGFLDHNLRSGDSLLGIFQLDQLTELTINPGRSNTQLRVFGRNVEHAVLEAIELRKRLREIPIRDIHDVEAMAQLNAEAQHHLEPPHCVADAMVGELLRSSIGTNSLENALAALAIPSERYLEGDSAVGLTIFSQANDALSADLPKGRPKRRPFHWPLEFPEVFVRKCGGFDAVIGNPPFLGGKKLTGVFGEGYREYLVNGIANGARGNADLIAYFMLRAALLCRTGGTLGLITSNSIAEGDTREVGLRQLLSEEAQIYHAISTEPWPGTASVATSRLHIYKGNWRGERILNHEPVTLITDSLTARDNWHPVKLKSNVGIGYQGSVVLGMGFTMSASDALQICGEHQGYEGTVLLPYLSGRDLNSSPSHSTERWVICFWDWDEEKAKEYETLYERVRTEVKPERDAQKRKAYRERWWRFAELQAPIYRKTGRLATFYGDKKGTGGKSIQTVICIATGATKYPCFAFVPNQFIYAHSLCVIASESNSLFACLSSDIHAAWAFEHGSRLEDRLRYTHGDVFETFPFPAGVIEGTNAPLAEFGRRLFQERRDYMLTHNVGMTKFYNDLHNPEIKTNEIQAMRVLQADLNDSVLAAYGYTDIHPEYGFHAVGYLPERDRIRFTISESARLKILNRLAELNRHRHEEETAEDLLVDSV